MSHFIGKYSFSSLDENSENISFESEKSTITCSLTIYIKLIN